MGKIFNFYTKNDDGINVDKTWYDSSNIKYSECLDPDDELKTLRVVFSNGTQYEYKGVETQQYLLFREDASQGKALNRLIKAGKYEYTKLDNVNLDDINNELTFRSGKGFTISNNSKFEIKNNVNDTVYQLDKELDKDTFDMLKDILTSLSINIKEV